MSDDGRHPFDDSDPGSDLGGEALAYVVGELDSGEAVAFERRLGSDPGLRAEVDRWSALKRDAALWMDEAPPGIDRLWSIDLPLPPSLRGPIEVAQAPLLARLRAWFLGGLRSGPALAWGGAALLAILGLLAFTVLPRRAPAPPGDSPHDALSNAQASTAARASALANAPHYLPGTSIVTGEDRKWLFGLGDEVRCAMSSETTLRVTSASAITLDGGSVWLWVKPGGRGFSVQTPHGLVKVVGTSFGVRAGPDHTVVEAVEGSVRLASAAGATCDVASGQMAAMDSASVGTVSTRREGAELPDWVRQLEQGGANSWLGAFLPSVSGAK